MPSFMYGAIFVNFLLLAVTVLWFFLKSPDSIISILLFLLFILGTSSFLFSYPLYALIIRKKHYHGLEKKVYRISLKWAVLLAFLITGLLGLSAFDLWNILNLGLFFALWVALLLGVLKNQV